MTDSIQSTEKFLEEFRRFSVKDLKNEIDVYNLLESIFRIDNFQLLEDLAFASKYCAGLFHILAQNKTELSDDYKKEIEQSFSETVEQIKSKLEQIILYFPEFERESFKNRYFEMTHAGINNLISLVNDFSEIKIFLNHRKRKKEF